MNIVEEGSNKPLKSNLFKMFEQMLVLNWIRWTRPKKCPCLCSNSGNEKWVRFPGYATVVVSQIKSPGNFDAKIFYFRIHGNWKSVQDCPLIYDWVYSSTWTAVTDSKIWYQQVQTQDKARERLDKSKYFIQACALQPFCAWHWQHIFVFRCIYLSIPLSSKAQLLNFIVV